MSSQAIVAVSSIVGAIAFFAAGYWTAKLKGASAVFMPPPDSDHPHRIAGQVFEDQQTMAYIDSISKERDDAVKRTNALEFTLERVKKKTKDHLILVHSQLAKLNEQHNKATLRVSELEVNAQNLSAEIQTARSNNAHLMDKLSKMAKEIGRLKAKTVPAPEDMKPGDRS